MQSGDWNEAAKNIQTNISRTLLQNQSTTPHKQARLGGQAPPTEPAQSLMLRPLRPGPLLPLRQGSHQTLRPRCCSTRRQSQDPTSPEEAHPARPGRWLPTLGVCGSD
jgi:hypothetical protein